MVKYNLDEKVVIITGASAGLGEQFAHAFTMRLLCLSDSADSQSVCGSCQSCQLFIAGSHPDLTFISPEEEGKQIKIAQIRELIEYVALKSFSGSSKIAIIEPADAMNRATANSLLKTLEEPPSQSMMLLLTHQPSKLPITIRSRCQRIDFEPVFDQASIDWLQTKLADTSISSESLLRLAGGGPLKAIELIEEDQLQFRDALINDLKSIAEKSYDPVQIAANWQAIGTENIISSLLKIIQDLIRLKLLREQAKLVNLDLKDDLQDLVNSLDLPELVRNYDFVLLKYQQSHGPMNYNPLSLLEEIVLNWNNPEIAN